MGLIREKDLASLRARVAASKGRVFLIVHPYYTKEAQAGGFSTGGPDATYFRVLEKMLTQARTPVIILEEKKKITTLKLRLLELGAHNCVVLPTIDRNPFLYKRRRLDADAAQRDLVNFLVRIGARTVLLGGQRSESTKTGGIGDVLLIMNEERLRKRANAGTGLRAKALDQGCVGWTYHNLVNNHFNTRLVSPALYPERPIYHRARRDESALRAREAAARKKGNPLRPFVSAIAKARTFFSRR